MVVPEAPYSNPNNYNRVAQRLAQEKNWFWANQFDNQANRVVHYRTTGPEIWEQTKGTVTAFVSAIGTGGTLAGTTFYIKERNPKITAVCADPYGAAMWSWFTNGNTDTNDDDSFAEGIGQMRVTDNLEGLFVDQAYRIPRPSGADHHQSTITRRRFIFGPLFRHQHCWSNKAREGERPGPNHRHTAVRHRAQIPVQTF